jgi:hypothetical protein
MAARSFHAIALVPDLLTSTRIENAVIGAVGTLTVVETDAELYDALADGPSFAVIDLSVPSLDVDSVAERCKQAGVPLVAFGPHVDAAGLRRARHAGIAFVYPRSKFLAGLNRILADVLAAAQSGTAAR